MASLIELEPLDLVAEARVTVRAAASNRADHAGAGGFRWWPALVTEPTIKIDLFDGDFSSEVRPAGASVSLALQPLLKEFPLLHQYDWAGAPVQLYDFRDGTLIPLATMRVDRFAVEDDRIALSLSVDTEPFAADVLSAEYAGTTGIEGGADLKGKPKPWIFGRALGVEPVLIDQIDNVFQVSGYGPVQAISAVFERGASFGSSQGNYADYAALVAANIPEGKWATCLAEGLFRLGAPPAGVITADVDGDNSGGFLRLTGAILMRIAQVLGISAKVDAASLGALDTAVPRNVAIQIDQQASFLDLARAMAAPCNAVAGIGLDGKLFITRVVFGASAITLDAQGRQLPPVLGMARQNTQPPYRRIVMGANRCWRVHGFDEIAFFDALLDKGLYDTGTTYREGNIVSSADKSRWLYTSATPTSGNAPPAWPTASNAFWSNLDPPATAANISYADGTPIEDLQPADPGATAGATLGTDFKSPGDVIYTQAQIETGMGTSAAFANQADIATDHDASARILAMRGDNLVRNGLLLEGSPTPTGFTLIGAVNYGTVTTGLLPNNRTWRFAIAQSAIVYVQGRLPVTGGSLYQSAHCYVGGPEAQVLFRFGATFYDQNGNATDVFHDVTLAGFGPQIIQPPPFTSPANAVEVQLRMETRGSSTRLIYVNGWRAALTQTGADVTATAQLSIVPQFPVIEIKQGEAGHTGNRTVTHVAKRGTSALTGGTWSLPSQNLGAGSASINASTGTVTLSGIVQSGAYAVRYTHTDGARIELPVNVSFVPLVGAGATANTLAELNAGEGAKLTGIEAGADVTATAQRSILPQFPTIEVRQYEAGNVGDRTVSHFAKRGETAIGGGTWSLPSVLLGAGTASINSSTGLVTLSGVAQSGAYTVRYTHTDGGQTELPVNVTFIPQEATGRSISATPSIVTWFQSSTTSRTVTHVAAQGSTTLTGGTWSLVSTSGMTASINSSTGLVTVSNATGSGNYRVRYTHTDTVKTELVVNLTYYPASDPGAPTNPNYNEP